MKSLRSKRPEDLLDNTAFLVTDIARLYRAHFDGEMKQLGLDRSDWWLITYLVYFNGCSQKVLTEMTDITKGGMGKLIDRMASRGFVRRESSKEDRRRNCIFLTPAGWALAAKVDARAVKATSRSVAPLTAAENRTLNALLTRMRLHGFGDERSVPKSRTRI